MKLLQNFFEAYLRIKHQNSSFFLWKNWSKFLPGKTIYTVRIVIKNFCCNTPWLTEKRLLFKNCERKRIKFTKYLQNFCKARPNVPADSDCIRCLQKYHSWKLIPKLFSTPKHFGSRRQIWILQQIQFLENRFFSIYVIFSLHVIFNNCNYFCRFFDTWTGQLWAPSRRPREVLINIRQTKLILKSSETLCKLTNLTKSLEQLLIFVRSALCRPLFHLKSRQKFNCRVFVRSTLF